MLICCWVQRILCFLCRCMNLLDYDKVAILNSNVSLSGGSNSGAEVTGNTGGEFALLAEGDSGSDGWRNGWDGKNGDGRER